MRKNKANMKTMNFFMLVKEKAAEAAVPLAS
jgi:hypothetical protein